MCSHLPSGLDGMPRCPLILRGVLSLSGPAWTSSQHGSWALSPLKGSEVPEYHFYHTLLVKASPRASPHSRGGEKNALSLTMTRGR